MSKESDTAHNPVPDAVPAQAPRRKRRRFISLGSLLVLVGVVCFGLILSLPGREFQLPDWANARARTLVSSNLKTFDASFGSLTIAFEKDLIPRVRLRDFVLRKKDGGRFVEVRDVDTVLAVTQIANGKFVPARVELAGAVVRVVRDKKGQFNLGFDATGETQDLASVIGMIDAALIDGPLSNLRDVDLSDITLQYDDLRAERSWSVDGGRIRANRSNSKLTLGGDFALLSGRDYVSTIEINASSEIGSPELDFGFSFNDMASEDISVQGAALTWLSLLRAPISGSLRSGFDANSQLKPLSATLQVGAGVIQPSQNAKPFPFDGMTSYFRYDPKLQLITFNEVNIKSQLISAKVEGQALLHARDAALPSGLTGQLRITDVAADLTEFFGSNHAISRGGVDFELEFKPFSIRIGQLYANLDGHDLRANGSVKEETAGFAVSLDAQLPPLSVAEVLNYWPPQAVPRTREWVSQNVLAGKATNGRFAYRLRANGTKDHHISFEFEDADLRYQKELPVLNAAAGFFQLENNRLVVMANQGKVVAPQGGALSAAGTVFEIPDVRVKPAPAKIDVRAEGSLTAMLSFLDHKPLGFISRAQLPVDLADGRAAIKAQITLPIKAGVKPNEITYAAQGTVSKFNSNKVIAGHTLAAPLVNVDVTQDAISIKGDGVVGRVPVTGQLVAALRGDELGQATVRANAVLSEEFVQEFNIGLPARTISGQGRADIEIKLKRGAPTRLTLTSDLGGVGLSIPQLGWSKSPKAKGNLNAEVTLGSPMKVDKITLSAPDLKFGGDITLNTDGSLNRFAIKELVAGSWLRAPVSIMGRGARAPDIQIEGGQIDMRRLPDVGGSGGSNGAGRINVRLNQLVVSEGIALSGFDGEFSTRNGLEGNFAGRVNGVAPIKGRVETKNGRSAFEITSKDAGSVLDAAEVLQNAKGGDFKLYLSPVGEVGNYSGKLTVTDTRLLRAPALAELLNVLSIVGLLEQLGKEGILFSEVETDFRLTPTQVIVTKGSAIGPSMGISLDGYYTLGSGQMDMQGVFSPLYILNGVGAVVSKRGEGLFGFNFGLKGTSDAPKVSVNPMSILTPGIFREIFRRPPPKPTE